MKRIHRKQKGGESGKGKVIKIISPEDGQDKTREVLELLRKNTRITDKILRFETDDSSNAFTIVFNKAEENEGQFNMGVGFVQEHPNWFARIHTVESNDIREIESGIYLYELCPNYFIQYHGIYHITGLFYLQFMDKIDYTLFKYIMYYLEQSPYRTDLPKIVNELCPMIYSLMFQKIVLQEMKYRRFQERYIDFKADNIGIRALPSDASHPTVVEFKGIGVKLPLQFELLGTPTVIRMILFDQQIVLNRHHTDDHAFIYDLIKHHLWAPYGRYASSKQFDLQGFRTDTKKETERNSYRGLIQAAECSHEKAYESIAETLLLDEGKERYKDIYRVVMNLLADSLMFPLPDKERVNTALPEGLSLYNASLIYENVSVFSNEFYKRIPNEDLRNYIRGFNVSTLITICGRVLKDTTIAMEPMVRRFYTDYDDGLRLKLQHCVYLNDTDFNAFISILRDSVKTIETFFKSDKSQALKKQNDTYEWIVPEFARIYTEQWISIYSTWRRLVRDAFILGEPKGDGKINLLEAKNEAWRFDAVFRDLVRVAGFSYNVGEERTMRVEMVPFVPPEKEVFMTLEGFKKIIEPGTLGV